MDSTWDMQANNNYPYITTLEKPLTYQYSKFSGFEFIESYKLFRLKVIRSLEPGISKEKKGNMVPDYLKKFGFKRYEMKSFMKKLPKAGIVKDKLSLLLFIQNKFPSKKMQEKVYEELSIFIKRYEVSKRIFTKNNSKIETAGNSYKDLSNYVLLAANLAIFYKKSNNLKFLNALLKLNDMLCSVSQEITREDIPMLYLAVSIELEEVKKLFDKRSLKL